MPCQHCVSESTASNVRQRREAGSLKLATLKAAIVLVPSYTAAHLTEQMVWVVPTLVAAGFFAASIDLRTRVDADHDDHDYKDDHKEDDMTVDGD